MLKVKSLKRILISVLMIALLGMGSSVYATSLPGLSNNIQPLSSNPSSLLGNTSSTTNTTGTANPIGSLNTSTGTTNTSGSSSVYGNTTTTKTATTSSSKNLPKTGVDYSVVFIIVACTAGAIFAYKKIREYNSIKY